MRKFKILSFIVALILVLPTVLFFSACDDTDTSTNNSSKSSSTEENAGGGTSGGSGGGNTNTWPSSSKMNSLGFPGIEQPAGSLVSKTESRVKDGITYFVIFISNGSETMFEELSETFFDAGANKNFSLDMESGQFVVEDSTLVAQMNKDRNPYIFSGCKLKGSNDEYYMVEVGYYYEEFNYEDEHYNANEIEIVFNVFDLSEINDTPLGAQTWPTTTTLSRFGATLARPVGTTLLFTSADEQSCTISLGSATDTTFDSVCQALYDQGFCKKINGANFVEDLYDNLVVDDNDSASTNPYTFNGYKTSGEDVFSLIINFYPEAISQFGVPVAARTMIIILTIM